MFPGKRPRIKNIKVKTIGYNHETLQLSDDGLVAGPFVGTGSVVGHIASNCSDDAELWCRICLKEGHMARKCSGGDGCCKCSNVGHLGKDCPEDWCFGRGGRLCYYCGMRGYMAVCSLCGERGHLGKDCW
ncbi:DNA-binding protein HEXBP [Tanacetum coccineum]